MDQILIQIFVGAVVALITALINQIFQGKVNYLWVLGGFIAAATLYGIYITQRTAPTFGTLAAILCSILFFVLLCRAYLTGFSQPPFIKWRVKHTIDEWKAMQERKEPCKGLISNGERVGEDKEEACQFKCKYHICSIYGPYIDHLPKGKYRAMFKLKVGKVLKNDLSLIQVDVAVRHGQQIAHRALSYSHFKQADAYSYFSVDFDISSNRGESDVEFRVHPPAGTGSVMTLDYVQLSRRLI